MGKQIRYRVTSNKGESEKELTCINHLDQRGTGGLGEVPESHNRALRRPGRGSRKVLEGNLGGRRHVPARPPGVGRVVQRDEGPN